MNTQKTLQMTLEAFLSTKLELELDKPDVIDDVVTLSKSKPFILGKCWCDCDTDIPIISKHRKTLLKFKQGHSIRLDEELKKERIKQSQERYYAKRRASFEINIIPCGCDCGTLMEDRDSRGIPRRFIDGHLNKGVLNPNYGKIGVNHPMYGKHHSEESRRKIGLGSLGEKNTNYGKIGEKHPCWVGDDVGYKGIHSHVRKYLPQPELCEICHKVKSRDLANIAGNYTRDFANWKYLCHKCHSLLDRAIDMSDRVCLICSSKTTFIKKSGRPQWHKYNDGHICANCYNRIFGAKKMNKAE